MSLKLYKQKRKFDKTPEPSGKEVSHQGKLKFVVQKHHATQLHYDFRLEADGVLKSWAVPKGPSTDPKVKRLAMMVEDHPFDYRSFEGVIPEGNYGAGKVIIWDEGTYEALTDPDNSDREIQKEIHLGSIKFRLYGKKLHGTWTLIKLKNAEDNAWLLIKEKDEHVSASDITQENESVVSGLDVEEVGEDTKPKSRDLSTLTKGIKKSKIPEFIEPMLTTLVDEPFDRENWAFEIKWDGYRAIADVDKGNVRLYSRNKILFNNDYPPIADRLSKLPVNAVFDGEIVVTVDNGRPDFQSLQNWRKTHEGNLAYYIFDILYLDGRNLMDLSYESRREILQKVIPEDDLIKISDYINEQGKEFFRAARKQGLEGIIAKKKDSTYQPGFRGNDWLKIKTHSRQEAIICGFTEPNGGRKHFGALILGVYDKGKLKYVGHTGSGFNDLSLKDMYDQLRKLKMEKSPFEERFQTNAPVTWVKPKLVCEVSFAEWTDDGHMRQPIFKGLRQDKEPDDVKIEKKKNETEILKKSGGEAKVSDVKITNSDKVFWPKEKYTKGDLAKYYEEISDLILPYLKDRPESLRRYPDGIDGQSFFQKDFTYKLPEFVDSIKIQSDTEDVNYIICNNKKTLLYMVNLGCIDINPWNSRTKNLDNPDYVIFDLDPEDIGFDKVVDAAVEIRKALEDLDIVSYPKTSGATGIHIYVPTGGKYSYDQVKQFAEIIVNIVNGRNPEYTSVLRSPSKRNRMVYLDFLQNRVGQTLAAPYSVRAKPGATVSAPLKWNEVTHKLSPKDFTIKNILKRVDREGDLWKSVLGPGIDLKKVLDKLSEIKE